MDGGSEALLSPSSDRIGCDFLAHTCLPMQSTAGICTDYAGFGSESYILNSFHGKSLAVPAVCFRVTLMLWSLGCGGEGQMSWIGGTGP